MILAEFPVKIPDRRVDLSERNPHLNSVTVERARRGQMRGAWTHEAGAQWGVPGFGLMGGVAVGTLPVVPGVVETVRWALRVLRALCLRSIDVLAGYSTSSPGRRKVGAACGLGAGFFSATSVSGAGRSTSLSVRTIFLPSTVMISRRATSLPLKRTNSTSSGGFP